MEGKDLIPYEPKVPAEFSPVEQYLARVRPEWQAMPLVGRVKRLLPVDPSSACQRLLNAAGHDLRSKIRYLGLDLAKDVANTFGLPRVNNDEDLEDYPTARLYDLAFRLGLLNRAEWRRMNRAYEIRRDLEHEDDEYEATTADLIYIFETAIDVVLSREPVQVIQLQDVNAIVESDAPIQVAQDIIDDYRDAPPQRQAEVFEKVTFWSLDKERPELVRANCSRLLRKIAPITPHSAKIELAKKLEVKIGRHPADIETAQACIISESFPYIHRRQQRSIIDAFLNQFSSVPPHWLRHSEHRELLDNFVSAGGFSACPSGAEWSIVRWMIEAYVGVPGQSGFYGRNRPVFYSDAAAPRIEAILETAPPNIKIVITTAAQEAATQRLLHIPEQRPRLERLVNITSSKS
ncbi:MAG: hypothetical protein HYX83_04815 [Chloroflexi bacterium]|nr:hypothetical protein [Chloroflexota bacterium]